MYVSIPVVENDADSEKAPMNMLVRPKYIAAAHDVVKAENPKGKSVVYFDSALAVKPVLAAISAQEIMEMAR